MRSHEPQEKRSMKWNLFRSRPTRQFRAAYSDGRLFRPCLEELEERRLLATFNWVVNGDGDFNTASNWRDENNLPGVPGVADDASIGFTGIAVTSSTFSKYDIGCALEKHQSPDCLGHDHGSALKLGSAVVLYALKR
jgi:hypothetical protein